MKTFEQFIDEAIRKTVYKGSRAMYSDPEKIGDTTFSVSSYSNWKPRADGSVQKHHEFRWSRDTSRGNDTTFNRSGKRDKKNGVKVWLGVGRHVTDMINDAKKNNEITSAGFSGNTTAKQRLYRKAAERIGKATGAKRIEHTRSRSIMHYESDQ